MFKLKRIFHNNTPTKCEDHALQSQFGNYPLTYTKHKRQMINKIPILKGKNKIKVDF